LYLRRITRSPLAYWLTVAALAAVTGLFVARLVGAAEAQRARFGALRRVAVATRPLAPGHVVTGGDVAGRAMPRAFVPSRPAGPPDALTGRTVVTPVFAGEPLLESHLAPAGLHGVAALLRRGERAVAVPVGAAVPAVRPGDRVDVLATFEDRATEVVAEDATVVDTAEDALTLALPVDDARRVADAATRATLTVAVRSPVEDRTA
jgi:pilus assembly protein CpaB